MEASRIQENTKESNIVFVPLHVKSDYSLGYGTASVDELVQSAGALGYRALALTDIENLYGQVRFHHQCLKYGIQPITGLELRTGFNGAGKIGHRSGRIILLAENDTGYRSLCHIVSHRRCAAKIREETADALPLVIHHSSGLFVLSDDISVIERLVAAERFPREKTWPTACSPRCSRKCHLSFSGRTPGSRYCCRPGCCFY